MRLGETNVLLNLINHQQPDIDKIYLYVKDPSKSNYQLLINRWEKVGIENLEYSRAFISYLHTIDNVYGNLKDYNPTKKKIIYYDLERTYYKNEYYWQN